MFAPLQSYSGRINQGFQVPFLLSTWQSYQDIDTFTNINISLFYNVPNAFKEVFAPPDFLCVIIYVILLTLQIMQNFQSLKINFYSLIR